MTDEKEKIKELISNNRLEDALKETLPLLESTSAKNTLALLSARYTELSQKIDRGIIDPNEADRKKNRISLGLLNLLEGKVEQSPELGATPFLNPSNQVDYIKKYGWILAILVAILMVLFLFKKQTSIIGIQGNDNDHNEVLIQQ